VTNRELLHTPSARLSALDKQRLFLLRVEGTPRPCPGCQQPVNVFDAAGIDLDAYDFGATPYAYRCPTCGAELEQVVPFLAGETPWHWQPKTSRPPEQRRQAFEHQSQAREDAGSVGT
jgi:hypothetical protein